MNKSNLNKKNAQSFGQDAEEMLDGEAIRSMEYFRIKDAVITLEN